MALGYTAPSLKLITTADFFKAAYSTKRIKAVCLNISKPKLYMKFAISFQIDSV